MNGGQGLLAAGAHGEFGGAEEVAGILLLVIVGVPLAQVLDLAVRELLGPHNVLIDFLKLAGPATLVEDGAGMTPGNDGELVDVVALGQEMALVFDGGGRGWIFWA